MAVGWPHVQQPAPHLAQHLPSLQHMGRPCDFKPKEKHRNPNTKHSGPHWVPVPLPAQATSSGETEAHPQHIHRGLEEQERGLPSLQL